jgi:endonuclease/exonuclease/phosphatase family metal-dependent hydrolase
VSGTEGHRNVRFAPDRLGVLFYNCHLFGSGGSARLISALRRLRDGCPLVHKDRERAELIARHLCDLAGRTCVDVAAFCEIWDDDIASIIRTMTAGVFPNSYRPSKSNSLDHRVDVYGSGLLILSRLPMLRIGRTPFRAECGDDAFSQKSYARVAVDCPGGRQVMVTWTHLQANTDERDKDSRRAQLDQIITTLTRSQATGRFKDLPVVLAGDMNIIAEDQNGQPTEEYVQMIATLGMTDSYRLAHPNVAEYPGYTSDPTRNKLLRYFHGTTNLRQRIDYLLWSDPADAMRLVECEIEEFATDRLDAGPGHLSDHFAVRATFEV